MSSSRWRRPSSASTSTIGTTITITILIFLTTDVLAKDWVEKEYEVFFNTGQKYDKTNRDKLPNQVEKSKVDVLGAVLKRHVAALRKTPNKQVELVFLVDSSASVGAENFFNELKFVKKLLADFTVEFNSTRVALITFSSRNRVVRHVDHLTNPSPDKHKCVLLKDEIPRITYQGGGTYTLGAVLQAQEVLQYARPKAAKAVFLVTDGYSNGGDPRPAAKTLRDQGVEMFTFGIQNGNVRELYDMASDPPEEHSYILDSFEEFEALARRALHEDLHIGSYLLQGPEPCSRLCVEGADCCDEKAQCTCGTHTGHYACLCEKGHYGTGLKGDCHPCPSGTYRSTIGPGDISSCVPCPDINHKSPPGSTSLDQCKCRTGFRAKGYKCKVLECDPLLPPKHGFFVNNLCDSVYNAACGIRCEPGYRLKGSSIRLCGENGTWTGEEPTCEMKVCPPLSAPRHGSVLCTSDSYVFDTDCYFTCEPGYYLVGSKKRTCLAIALWDGLPALCRSVSCSSLPALVHGTVSPSKCTLGKSSYGDVCSLTCDHGFHLSGHTTRQCVDPGVWSGEDQPSECVDIKPPVIKCPEDIVVDAEANEASAEIAWKIPTASDNSGEPPSISVIPAIVPPRRFDIGVATVTYVAEDRSKNRVECNFTVTVRDIQPPTVDKCLSPPKALFRDPPVSIAWEEPIFSDNSGSSVTVRRSHEGGYFPLGETEVTYEAIDLAGNNSTCIIIVSVQEHECTFPVPPAHGQANCTEKDDGVYCTLSCDKNYAFALKTAPPVYFCAYDGVWQPADMLPFPDCSETLLSNTISMVGLVTVMSEELICDDHFRMNQVEKHLQWKISSRLNLECKDKVQCTVGKVIANCKTSLDEAEEESNIILRRKRHLSWNKKFMRKKRSIAIPHVLAKSKAMSRNVTSHSKIAIAVPSTPPTYSFGEVTQMSEEEPGVDLDLSQPIIFSNSDLGSSAYQESSADGATTGSSEVTNISSLDSTYLLGPHSEKNNSDPDSSVEDHTYSSMPLVLPNVRSRPTELPRFDRHRHRDHYNKIELQFQLTGSRTDDGHDSSGQQDQDVLVGSVKEAMLALEEAAKRGELDLLLGPNKLRIEAVTFQDEPPKFECETGSISKGPLCVKCPAGTFFNVVSQECGPCSLGTYQFQEGQLSCLVCPKHTSTATGQSKSIGECKAQCLPGSLSRTGLEPCQTCPLGHYQPHYAKTSCLPCPGSTTTHRRGTRQQEECKEPCPPGHVSRTGLLPCFPCPNGYYQPRSGERFCLQCPGGSMTGQDGAVRVSSCEGADNLVSPIDFAYSDLPINDCFSVPCFNGATCEALDFGFRCICPPGFTGIYCQEEVNECDSSPCRNNATCRDLVNGYSCDCYVGFTGTHCEQNIDDCLFEPCYNGATCIDQVNRFHCKCAQGFVGPLCQYNIDECISSPCQNNATCRDLIANYSCDCQPGFSGRNCETNIDDCESKPCLNNATCIDGIEEYKCQCLPGFRGTVCEEDINECDPQPCMNSATCLDQISGFTCLCAPSFTGDLCETELSSDFLLHFPSAGTLDFVQLDGLRRPLDRFTLCTWMKTSDRLNYGTPVSYADDTADNLLTLTDYSGFVFYVNTEKVVTDVTANDGNWHHICVTWASVDGLWAIYKDGILADKGTGLSPNTLLPGDGILILGQEQDQKGAGFSTPESFIGTMTLFNIWDYILPPEDIAAFSTRCDTYRGNIRSWPDFIVGIRGKVEKQDSHFCRGCSTPPPPNHGDVSVSGVKTSAIATYACSAGYNLEGSVNRRCLVYGNWSGPHPICARISCGFPGYLANGYINGRQHLFEDSVQYICNPNYRLIGESVRTCQSDSHWSGTAPHCEEILCPTPAPLDNGRVEKWQTKHRPGHHIQYICDEGYRLDGTSILTCDNDGQWNETQPVCQPRSCESPPRVPHGRPIAGHQVELDVGREVYYECEEGFQLLGPGVMRCALKNRWEGDLPRCERVSCGTPPRVEFATAEGRDYRYGGMVTYRCERGYEIVGDAQTVCQANGVWSGEIPRCEPVTCGPLHHPEHGYVEVPNTTFGTVAKYLCHVGYELQGIRSRKCRATGEWSGDTPRCVPVSCSQPESISNGRYSGSDWTVGNTVTYLCNAGYLLIGEQIRVCLESGHWLHDPPSCEPIECPPPEPVENAVLQGTDFRFGQRVQYHCDTGYQLVGQGVRVCMEDQRWGPEPPLCRPVSCGPPLQVENGEVIAPTHTFGNKAKYTCTEGFRLMGNSTLVCQADGTWSRPYPRCEIIQCPKPLPVPHAYLIYPDTRYGSVVEYYCDEGYRLHGPVQRLCQGAGDWTDEEPLCQRVRCPDPAPPTNGNVKAEGIFYGSIATYTCRRTYELKGSRNRTCQQDETWSGVEPICEVIRCPLDEVTLLHGRVFTDHDVVGSAIQYECEIGYEMIGHQSRICREDKRWEGLPPECKIVTCPPPVAPPHGEVIWRGYSYGDTLTYNCHEGYQLTDTEIRTCLSNGSWSWQPPSCDPVPCLQLVAPSFGRVNVTKSHYGGHADYQCNLGYRLLGPSRRTCLSNRTWSKHQPSCERITCPTPPQVHHGRPKDDNFTYGAHMSYVCDLGYKLSPVKTTKPLLCGVRGRWEGHPPHCEIVTCPTPSAPRFGAVHVTSITYGSEATFRCNPSWDLVGEKSLWCDANGEWNGSFPTCVGTICPPPENVPNARIEASDYLYGTTIEYSCLKGYRLHGKSRLTCQVDNTWNAKAPSCQPIPCHEPPVLANGSHNGSQFHFGKSVAYKCDSGFQLHGTATLTCTENATWSADPPVCELVSCPIPDPLPEGEITMQSPPPRQDESSKNEIHMWPVLNDLPRGDITVDGKMVLEGMRGAIFHLGDQVRYRCKSGYVLEGLRLRTCEESGQWTGDAPQCQPITCGPPEKLSNGQVVVSTMVFKAIANYSCKVGYRLIGHSTRECLANGSWSNGVPTCASIVCPRPQVIPHGHVTWTSLRYGAVATYECLVGYQIQGNSPTRTCGQAGLWDGEEPFCVPIECPPPDVPQNGWIQTAGLHVGDEANFHCHEGYEIEGATISTCLLTGNWSQAFPVCRRVTCPTPPTLKHGFFQNVTFYYEDTVNYGCKHGYRLEGGPQRTCHANRTWSEEDILCVPLPCNRPTAPSHGTVLFRTLTVGSLVQFTCREGYEISGPTSSKCLSNQMWNLTQSPSCHVVTCQPITTLPFGTVIGSDFDFEAVLRFECQPGYEIVGPSEIHCEANKQWSNQIPECRRHLCDPPNAPANVILQSGPYVVGKEVGFSCPRGYKPEHNATRRCNLKGKWHGTPPSCQMIECGAPPSIPSGVVLQTDRGEMYGSKAVYGCEEHYDLEGENALVCGDEGKWEGTLPVCNEITCDMPPTIPWSTVVTKRTGPGVTEATYSCVPGYRLVGSEKHTCVGNQLWRVNGSISCEQVSCGDPPSVTYGTAFATGTTPGSQANYTCHPGYRHLGMTTLYCSVRGLWEGLPPRCVPVTCPQPPAPENGVVEGEDLTYLSAVLYSCLPGYQIYGRDTRFCLEDGTWSGEMPFCQMISCGEISPPENGYINHEITGKYGDYVRFTCHEGYTMIGSTTAFCQEDGSWNVDPPECREVSCPPPVSPANTIPLEEDEFSVGTSVTFICEPGYKPSGEEMTVHCLENSTWSSTTGTCHKVSCGRPKVNSGAIVLGMSYLFKDRLVVTCPPGSRPKGKVILSCSADGKWDGQPTCEAMCPRPCLHGGVCIPPGLCSCPSGYVGDVCQHAICILPCLNGGTCTGPFSCHCKEGYTGSRCQTAVCQPKCQNNGRCISPNKCRCPPNFTGPGCESRFSFNFV